MARNPKPQAQAAAPGPESQPATATIPPGVTVPADDQGAGQAERFTQPESTLGDGDAKGAEVTPSQGSTAPDAPAPDVVSDEDHSQRRGPEDYAVVVTGPAKGRWRIGRKFGPDAVSIPVQELTEPELRALDEDPELSLKLVPIED
jgi:hypothetical protein